jgi:hypothetical protein
MTAEQIKETFDFLYLNEKHLSAGQSDFISGCKKHFHKNKELSEKQLSALLEIKKFLKINEPVRTTMNTK